MYSLVLEYGESEVRALVQTKLKERTRVLSVLLHILYSVRRNISLSKFLVSNFSFSLALLPVVVTCLITSFDLRDPESVRK